VEGVVPRGRAIVQTKSAVDAERLVPSRRVGVVHEHGVLRRGVADCLNEEEALDVSFVVAEDPPHEPIDVAVVSCIALAAHSFDCAVVVFDLDVDELGPAEATRAAALLSVGHVTAEQLVASVRAAAVGLMIGVGQDTRQPRLRLDERRIAVLQMLASGDTTRTISSKLAYSERTIKSLIRDLESQLSATNRAQAVAEAIRLGII
jgi:DNA-binding CsgD family transcriptional regulator